MATIMKGREGRRSPEQRRLEIAKRATTAASDKFGLGGRLKQGKMAPKPVSLAKIDLPPLEEDEA